MRRALLALPLLLLACTTDKTDDTSADDTAAAGGDGGAGDGGGTGGDEGGGTGGDNGGVTEPDWPSGEPAGCDLTTTSYNLDFRDARVISPPGLGALLLDPLGTALSVGFSAQDDTSVTAFMALTEDDGQDLCSPTIAPPPGSWADPVLEIGPADIQTEVDGSDVTLSGFQFAAATTADCTALTSGVFIADLDVRLHVDLLGGLLGTTDIDEMCTAFLGFGAECSPCSSDSEPYCLSIVVDQLPAAALDTPLVERSEDDIAADADCG